MKIILLILIFFNLSCSLNPNNDKFDLLEDKSNSFYFDSPTMSDFLLKINEYTKESKYPNLNN